MENKYTKWDMMDFAIFYEYVINYTNIEFNNKGILLICQEILDMYHHWQEILDMYHHKWSNNNGK